jgi:hypothetical protein
LARAPAVDIQLGAQMHRGPSAIGYQASPLGALNGLEGDFAVGLSLILIKSPLYKSAMLSSFPTLPRSCYMVTARHPLLSLVLAVSLALPVAACAAPSSSHPVPDVGNAVSPVPGVVSSSRLDASDVATLQANGFRQVIDLTPDDETPVSMRPAWYARPGWPTPTCPFGVRQT